MLSETQKLISTVVPLLRHGEILPAIKATTTWLTTNKAPGMRYLLEACPQEEQPRLVALLRDLVDDYPSRLLAAPVLICAHPEGPYLNSEHFLVTYPPDAGAFYLPHETSGGSEPGKNLIFLGWVDPAETSPFPRQEILKEPRIHWGKITGAVALFEWYELPSGEFMPTLDSLWFGKLMADTGVNLCMTTLEASDFPTAAETARVMLAASRPNRSETTNSASSYFFLTEATYRRAKMEGARFGRICARDYPEHRG